MEEQPKEGETEEEKTNKKKEMEKEWESERERERERIACVDYSRNQKNLGASAIMFLLCCFCYACD